MCAGILNLTGVGCLIKASLGIDCPFCGMTRAWIKMMNGDLKGAFGQNFLFPLLGIMIFLIPVRREDVSYRAWIAVNVMLSGIGLLFGLQWALRLAS